MFFYKTELCVGLLVLLLTGCGGGGGNPAGLGKQPVVINFLPVGQADATYIAMPNGQTVLIDGGNHDDVLEELAQIGASGTIDLVIMTHPDIDHIGGLFKVLDHYDVGQVWETGASVPIISDKWQAALQNKHIPVRQVKRGDWIKFGEVTLRVLGPEYVPEGYVSNPNRYSLVCQLEYGHFKALFMGDATSEEQKEFLDLLGPVDIFKVPHHGAADAAYEKTYMKTRPKAAVLTLGVQSQYVNLPTKQATDLLDQYAGTVYRTYPDGRITFTSKGESL